MMPKFDPINGRIHTDRNDDARAGNVFSIVGFEPFNSCDIDKNNVPTVMMFTFAPTKPLISELRGARER